MNTKFALSFLQCWSSDGYHLWMLPIDAMAQRLRERQAASESTASGSKRSSVSGSEVEERDREETMNSSSAGCHGENGRVLVMRFLKNSIVNNPIVVGSKLCVATCIEYVHIPIYM